MIVLDALAELGGSPGQVVVVLAFYVYCAIAPCGRQLFCVLSVPIFTQFLHLFQRYDFTGGANSLWRLLPFVLVDLRMAAALLHRRSRISRAEQCGLIAWIVINFGFLAISPNLSDTIVGGFLLYLCTIPLSFVYLGMRAQEPTFAQELERCYFLLFIVLGLGTFGLVYFGSRYKGSDVLLVTRNISDTNVTMAYFILLWPFVIRYVHRRGNLLLLSALVMLFAGAVIVSFSRGAVFIVGPYLIITWMAAAGRWVAPAAIGFLLLFQNFMFQDDLAYSWQLRFGDDASLSALFERLQEASGRADIHRQAFALFLENPLVGHGIASFEVMGPGYREAHSMYYTLLAEQGLLGAFYVYSLFGLLALRLSDKLFVLALFAYLAFVHLVGSVFVIIPAKSLTINCIAPILLISMYHYAQSKKAHA